MERELAMSLSVNPQLPLREIGHALLARHGDALYRYALLRLRRAPAAEDAVQDTLLAALAKLRDPDHAFQGRSSERTWLIGILRHKIADHLRRSARESPPQDATTPPWEDFFDRRGHWRLKPSDWRRLTREDPHASLERAELREILTRCLQAMPDRLARLFMLREADDVDSGELCQLFDISATNLWTLLHRARTRLRQCLDAHGIAGASTATGTRAAP